MHTPKWDRRFLRLAEHVSTWSKDPSSQIGVVLADQERKIVGLGYNGFPRGMRDLPERYEDRDFKYRHIVHGEVNAILAAGPLARGASLYVWPAFGYPNICRDCCKVAIQAGIGELVGAETELDPERLARWGTSLEDSARMLAEAGIPWRKVRMDD
jgi:dCMP deaminase